jgi:hypothetical protein
MASGEQDGIEAAREIERVADELAAQAGLLRMRAQRMIAGINAQTTREPVEDPVVRSVDPDQPDSERAVG